MGRAILTLVLCFALPAAAWAQPLRVGDPVRVMMENPNPFKEPIRREVLFDRLDGGTLWVDADGTLTPVPIETAAPMIRSDEHQGKRGAVLGMLVGTGVGAMIGHLSYGADLFSASRCDYPWPGAMPRNCRSLGTKDRGSRAADTLGAASVGFWIGLGGGYLIGRLTPKWVHVDVQALQAHTDQVNLGVTIRR